MVFYGLLRTFVFLSLFFLIVLVFLVLKKENVRLGRGNIYSVEFLVCRGFGGWFMGFI